MDIKKISDKIYRGADRDKKDKMDEIYYEMANFLKENNHDWYQKFYEKAEDIIYNINDEQARQIVMSMKPYGQRWSMEEIREYLKTKGETNHEKCYYLVMNSAYNDYARTARQYNVDVPEFYYDIAYDFIHDEDGKKHKVEKYFLD